MKKTKEEFEWAQFSKAEILLQFIKRLASSGMDSIGIGNALADIWLALPEDIE